MTGTFATSHDPECDAVYWDKPVKESCPKCVFPVVLDKTMKKDGTVRHCQNDDSDYKMAVDTQA